MSKTATKKSKKQPLQVSPRVIKLGSALALLLGVWVYFFSGLFHEGPTLEITTGLQAPRGDSQVARVTFAFNRDILPDEVFVFQLDADNQDVTDVPRAKRRSIQPVWHLVTHHDYDPEKNRGRKPRAIRAVGYGRYIRGLKRADPEVRALPLEPDVPYRAIISGEGMVGHVDFQTKSRPG